MKIDKGFEGIANGKTTTIGGYSSGVNDKTGVCQAYGNGIEGIANYKCISGMGDG